jgi:hypothetical protein
MSQQNQGLMQIPSNPTVAQHSSQGYAGGLHGPGRAQYSNTINASNINVGKRGHLSQTEQFLKNTYGAQQPAVGGAAGARGIRKGHQASLASELKKSNNNLRTNKKTYSGVHDLYSLPAGANPAAAASLQTDLQGNTRSGHKIMSPRRINGMSPVRLKQKGGREGQITEERNARRQANRNLVLSVAADNRLASSVVHTEEDQRPIGGAAQGFSAHEDRLQSLKTG